MSLLTWTWRVLPSDQVQPASWVKSDSTMRLSCWLRQWSRRLETADNVTQTKNRAMLLARDSTTSCVSKPNGRSRSSNSSTLCCTSPREPAGSRARDWDTILSSHWTMSSSTLRQASSSASTPTTTETHTHTTLCISLLTAILKMRTV